MYRNRVYNRRVYNKRRLQLARKYRPRTMKSQMLKPVYNGRVKQPIHYHTRYYQYDSIVISASTTATYGVVYIEFANIPAFAELRNMYDSYKITAAKVNFIPLTNVTLTTYPSPGASLTAPFNRIFTVVDYNDRTVPTSIDDLRQYSNCKWSPITRIHKRFLHLQPTMTVDADASSGSTVGIANNVKVPWVSTSSDTVEWFGLKYGIIHPSEANAYIMYNVEIKLYMQFKGPR